MTLLTICRDEQRPSGNHLRIGLETGEIGERQLLKRLDGIPGVDAPHFQLVAIAIRQWR